MNRSQYSSPGHGQRGGIPVTVPYKDSFIRTRDVQEILWTQMKNGFELDIVIISPLKAHVTQYKKSSYVKFFCQSLSADPDLFICKGDYLYVQFPLKTWERGMYSLPISLKRDWCSLGNNNLRVRFVKVRSTLLAMLEIGQQPINAEQSEMAELYYPSPDTRHNPDFELDDDDPADEPGF